MTFTLAFSSAAAAAEPDVLIADFESKDYGEWKVEGEAFGPGPARGTLPHQMRVSGFKGERLVNTFYEGDGTTGTLTSPPFTIERPYINFLIGGGGYPGKTSIQLLADGRAAGGHQDRRAEGARRSHRPAVRLREGRPCGSTV